MYLSTLVGIRLLRQPYIVTLMWVVAPISIHQVLVGTIAKLIYEQTKLRSVPFFSCQAAYLVHVFFIWPIFLQKKQLISLSCFFYTFCLYVPKNVVYFPLLSLFLFLLVPNPLDVEVKWALSNFSCYNIFFSCTHWAISSFKVHFFLLCAVTDFEWIEVCRQRDQGQVHKYFFQQL